MSNDTSTEQPVAIREVLSVKQLVVFLGVSESVIRRLIKQNEIPFVRIGGSYKFFLPEIRKWLVQATAKPATPSNGDAAVNRANEIWNSTIGN